MNQAFYFYFSIFLRGRGEKWVVTKLAGFPGEHPRNAGGLVRLIKPFTISHLIIFAELAHMRQQMRLPSLYYGRILRQKLTSSPFCWKDDIKKKYIYIYTQRRS